MIEMPTVRSYGGYGAYNNEAKKKGNSGEASFQQVLGGREVEQVEESPANGEFERSNETHHTTSMTEMVTYTFLGKLQVLGLFSGRNINLEV